MLVVIFFSGVCDLFCLFSPTELWCMALLFPPLVSSSGRASNHGFVIIAFAALSQFFGVLEVRTSDTMSDVPVLSVAAFEFFVDDYMFK